jgi:hypothetical protein
VTCHSRIKDANSEKRRETSNENQESKQQAPTSTHQSYILYVAFRLVLYGAYVELPANFQYFLILKLAYPPHLKNQVGKQVSEFKNIEN